MRANTPLATVLLILAVASPTARAGGIHKCTMPDGLLVFTEAGCSGAATISRYATSPPAVSNGAVVASNRRDYAEYQQRERYGTMAKPARPREQFAHAPATATRLRGATPRVTIETPPVVTEAAPPSFARRQLAALSSLVVAPAKAAPPAADTGRRPGGGEALSWNVSSTTRHTASTPRRVGSVSGVVTGTSLSW